MSCVNNAKKQLNIESNEKEAETQHFHLESKSLRSFKSSDEYLFAMKEDLAEWLNNLYAIDIRADNFMDKLETGVILCRHANNVLRKGRLSAENDVSAKDVPYKSNVEPKTFQARDNVSNFISWCRTMKIHDCLLFETEDLVLRKNERSFIICLLEVARKGSHFGFTVPLLVQMEQEIDREMQSEAKEEPVLDERTTSDLKQLHQRVVDLLGQCSCPSQYPMIQVKNGKYRIGDTKTLLFVRILRNHVMVRVGGGWDTLQHYLNKHDPCRCCQSGQKSAKSTKLTVKTNSDGSKTELFVTYDRTKRNGNGIVTETSPTASSATSSRRSSSSSLSNCSISNSCSPCIIKAK